MSKSLVFYLSIISSSYGIDYQLLFGEANDFFINKNYKRSIELYEQIIESGQENSTVFYNLGNAYYRLGDIGQAIWAYRNAKRLSPRDKDITHNLKIAEAKKIDRINSPPLFILHDFYRKIKSSITIFELIFLGGILFFILSLLWIKQSFSGKRNGLLKNIFQIFVALIIIVHIFILDMVFEKKRIINEAIIVEKFDAQSGPFFGDNKVLFQINKGSDVEVLEEKNDWSEIILIDGKKGWVLSKALRKMK
ncbi:MAG: hypothetical protein CMF99_00670 [Candidatus Marinimicrobia bacterium]|nr:hypothetical protein [Candidatus Neomarinimicrobiota bacterium]|tara:strand:+ start:739 stop:1488 length:750 start_codon:yes stop_codon:yes gene_type:complete